MSAASSGLFVELCLEVSNPLDGGAASACVVHTPPFLATIKLYEESNQILVERHILVRNEY